MVAEKNQGSDMVESVLPAAAFGLPVELVAAIKGKAARAEPIALHFEAGRAKLAGNFPTSRTSSAASPTPATKAPETPPTAPTRWSGR